MSASFKLIRNAFGKLVFTSATGQVSEGVIPVRAFPIGAPNDGLSLVDVDGHELLWLDTLQGLPADELALIEQELNAREFMPEILAIEAVSTFSTPSMWTVITNRGQTQFILKGEEDIRRMEGSTLLVADSHGIQFLIRDKLSLDRHSRKLLDRFL